MFYQGLRISIIGILAIGWMLQSRECDRRDAERGEAVEAAVLKDAETWHRTLFAKDAEIARLSQALEDEQAGRAAAAQHMSEDWALHEAQLRDQLRREHARLLVELEQRWLKLIYREH